MKKNSLRLLILLSISLCIFYFLSFKNFLFQDDFFNIKLSQSQTLLDAFNIFKRPIMNFYFYRPFSTQLFWSVGYNLFNLHPFGFHIINFVFFIFSIFLVYKLTLQIFSDEKIAILTSFFYAYSGSQFYRLFFLSQFQEVSLAVFTFATIIAFIKKSSWTPFLFILALTTKETAVMIVPAIFITAFLMNDSKKEHFKLFIYCLIILTIYLIVRKFFFGFAGGQTYQFDFAPKKVLNNFFWYNLWGLGIPEDFVNVKIFQFPTILNPQLFTKFGSWGNPTLLLFGIFIVLIIFPVIRLLKKIDKKIVLAFSFFVLFLLPVAFFPFHKFPYSLALPLLGSSMILSVAIAKLSNRKILLICGVYFLLSTFAYAYNLQNHWSIKRAYIAEAVFNYFRKNYPNTVPTHTIYFRDTLEPICLDLKDGPRYSQEVEYGIGTADELRLLYKDKTLSVYFEDIDTYKHLSANALILDSRQFMR